MAFRRRRQGGSIATQQAPVALRRGVARFGGRYAVLARSGLVAKGVSYGIVGLLAVKLAAGAGGTATSRNGALQTLAQHPFGKVVLILLALGFAAYAIWRFVQAFAEQRSERDEALKAWGKRFAYIGRGFVYAGLTFSAAKILVGAGGGGSQNEKAHKTTAAVLSWPGGTWIVAIGGGAIVAAGSWNLYRGLSRSFEHRWQSAAMGERARKWGGRLGLLGHVARAVVFGLIGIFVVKAAVDYSPRDAIGLDGALQKLAHASYGPYLLGVTAAGLVCYGLYCLVDARYRDVSAR